MLAISLIFTLALTTPGHPLTGLQQTPVVTPQTHLQMNHIPSSHQDLSRGKTGRR